MYSWTEGIDPNSINETVIEMEYLFSLEQYRMIAEFEKEITENGGQSNVSRNAIHYAESFANEQGLTRTDLEKDVDDLAFEILGDDNHPDWLSVREGIKQVKNTINAVSNIEAL